MNILLHFFSSLNSQIMTNNSNALQENETSVAVLVFAALYCLKVMWPSPSGAAGGAVVCVQPGGCATVAKSSSACRQRFPRKKRVKVP